MPTKKAAIIAHRGNSSEAPENTRAAFQSANDLRVDFLELDIHLTKDEALVVFHDAHIGRTTESDYPYKISELSLKEIKNLEAGSWFDFKFTGERVPTLEEVFQEHYHPNLGIMIEVKVTRPEEVPILGEKLLAFYNKVKKTTLMQNSLFGSFSSEMLDALSQKIPGVPLIGISENNEQLKSHLKCKITHTAISQEQASLSLIKYLKELRKEVWIYSVDDPVAAGVLESFGASGLITNKPRLLISELRTQPLFFQ